MVKLVQGLGSTKAYRYPQKDLLALARYANGLNVQSKEEKITDGLSPMNLLSYPLTISVFNGCSWLKNNKGNYKNAFSDVVKEAQTSNAIFKKSGVTGVLRNVEAQNILSNIPVDTYTKTLSKSTQDLYAQAKSLATNVVTSNSKDALKQASQKLVEANAAEYLEQAAKSTGIFSKVKNALGITAVNKGLNNLAIKSPTFSKCLDAYRNEAGTFMLLMEGGVEALTNVAPTFKQLGAKKGFKQLGKSVVTTISSVAGWVAGSVLGSKLGNVAKAAIGNSKVGAVIGAVAERACSYVGGSIAQHFTSKLAHKAVGKSELDKAKEEETQALAEMAQNDEEVLQALLETANQRMEVEGTETEDYKLVQEACKNLIMSQQPSPMLNREQLAAVAKSLEDPQLQIAPQNVQTKATDSERAQTALRNSAAFIDKISNTILK